MGIHVYVHVQYSMSNVQETKRFRYLIMLYGSTGISTTHNVVVLFYNWEKAPGDQCCIDLKSIANNLLELLTIPQHIHTIGSTRESSNPVP